MQGHQHGSGALQGHQQCMGTGVSRLPTSHGHARCVGTWLHGCGHGTGALHGTAALHGMHSCVARAQRCTDAWHGRVSRVPAWHCQRGSLGERGQAGTPTLRVASPKAVTPFAEALEPGGATSSARAVGP